VSWVGSDTWDVYLGIGEAGLRHAQHRPTWHPHESPQAGLAAQLERIKARTRGRRLLRARVRILLSGALARPFLLQLPDGLRNEAEARALGEALAPEATGLTAPCNLWLSSTRAGETCLAVAMEQALRTTLLELPPAMKFRVASIRPWWAHALDRANLRSPGFGLFAARDSDSLTLLGCADERWNGADSYAPRPADAQIESLITRRVFSAGLAEQSICRVRLDVGRAQAARLWPGARAVNSFAPA
jgi:hypothetical protein